MRFQVLGPLTAWDGQRWMSIPAAQPRQLLAVLLAEAGRAVSRDRLEYEIWGEDPPRTAANAVQVYIGRLRRRLGSGSLVTRGRGYELAIDDLDVDAGVYERLARSGHTAVAQGRLTDATAYLGRALALWRGPALADVTPTPAVSAYADRLERSRLATLELRLDLDIESGRPAVAV